MKNTLRFIKQGSSKIKFAQTMLSFCVLVLLVTINLKAQSTITFDAESFIDGQEIPDNHSFSANGKTFNIFAGTFNGGVSGEGGMFYIPSNGSSLPWYDYDTVFGDGGFIFLDHTTNINRRWYDPEALIIKTTDGSDFKFTSFKAHDAGFDSWGNYLKITGYKDGVSLGSESVVIVSDVAPWHSTVTLTDPVFDSVDEVRITLDKDNHPNYPYNGDTDMDGLYHSFDTFVVDNAVSSATSPTVTTSAASSITATGATLSGNVTDDGGDTVTERGFVYATSTNPTTSDTKVQDESGTGAFEEAITGLNPEVTYYVRAYAINGEGTSYGSEESFTTSAVTGEKFDFESVSATYTGWSTKTLTVEDNDIDPTFTVTATADNVFNGSEKGWAYNGSEGLYFGWDALETQVDFEIEAGNSFDLKGFHISHQGDSDTNPTDYTLSTEKGSITINPPLDEAGELTYIDVAGNANAAYFQDITSFTLQAPGSGAYFEIDDIILDDFQVTNQTPTFTTLADAVETTNEDTGVEILFSSIAGQADASDPDGTVDAYVVQSVSSGTLTINGSPFDAGLNDEITPAQSANWTPAADANGTLDAFTLTAKDNSGAESSPAVQAQVEVSAVNDDPAINNLPANIIVTEDVASNVDLSASTFSDPDAGINDITLTLAAGVGTLTASGSGGVTTAGSGTRTLTLTGSASNIDTYLNTASNIQYTTEADGNGTSYTTITLTANDGGNTGSGGGTDVALGSFNVNATAYNDAPVFTGLDGSPSYTEGGAAVLLDSDVTVSDIELDALNGAGGNYAGASLTIVRNGGANASDRLSINSGGNLTIAGSPDGGGTVSAGGNEIATIANTGNGQLQLTFANNGTIPTTALVNETLQAVQYTNASNDPASSVQLDWTFSDGNSGSQGTGTTPGTVTGSTTVSVTNVNDAPTLSATPKNPGFTEGDAAPGATLYELATASAVEASQRFESLSLTIDNITDGASEIVFIDGSDVELTDGNTVTTATNNLTVNVSVSGNTATVNSSGGSLTNSQVETLISGLSYRNTSDNPTTTTRNININGIRDDGGTANGGSNFTNPGIISSVSITAVNDAPVASNVSISGTTTYDEELTGSYDYTDAEGDAEDGSTFKWYRSDDAAGNGKTEIAGATGSTYTLINDDVGKYISFEVTPSDGSLTGSATESALTGPISLIFAGGDGTAISPYQVATDEQLYYVRDFSDKHFEQTADIDLSAYSNWEPIGDTDTPFTGNYDGGGHSITGLSLDRSGQMPPLQNSGLFGSNAGTIQNVSVQGSVTGDYYNGVLAGENTGTITDVTTSGTVDGDFSGGLIGTLNGGTVTGSSSSATVTAGSSEPAGGLVGTVETGTITQSYATGAIESPYKAGGLVGLNKGTINESYASGNVEGAYHIGGLVGENSGIVEKSYAVGDVTATQEFVGGLIGTNASSGTVANSYSTGKVNGNSYKPDDWSGLIGQNNATPADIGNSFWDLETSARSTSNGGTGKTSSEMKTKSTFTDAGWDFTSVWQIDEPGTGNISYPYLQNNTQSPVPGYLEVTTPTVATGETISNITAHTADVSGTITDNGNLDIEKKGFVWAPADDLTDTTRVWVSGAFSTTLTNLPPFTEISVSATAFNAAGGGSGTPETFTTQKAELTVGGTFTVQNKVYDGGTSATIDQDNLTLSGVYTGHDVQIGATELEFGDKNAGTGKTVTIGSLTLTGADADKYTVSLTGAPTATADITLRPITVTADAATAVYGDTDPAFTYQVTSGSLPQDDAITGTLSREAGNDVGTYKILQGDVTAGSNFDLTFVSADFTITPKTLAVQADTDQSKVYGTADPTLTYSATGFEHSDDESIFTGSLERAAGEATGTYAINQGSLDAGANYTIDFTGADFTITGKELVITVDEGLTKVYGAADPAFTYTASGFESGDDESVITGSLSRESGEDAGKYAITAGNISAGDNYAITLQSDSLHITPKTLTVTAETGQTKVYGEADPAFSYTASGFAFSDDESLFTGSLSRDEGEDTGNYALTAGDLSAGGNYTIDFITEDFTITPATLVVEAEAGQTKFEGEADPEFSYTASGFVWDDEVSIVTGQLSREQGESPGIYALQLGSLDAPNYNIDFTSADFTILRTPPVAEQLAPSHRAGKVPVDTTLFARFDQPIELSGSAQIRLQSSSGEEAAIRWRSNQDSLIITPDEPLGYFTHYTLTIDAGTVQNQDEITNAEISWAFVTEMAVPAVRFPTDAATDISTAPKLEWNSAAENTNAHLQFADNAELSNPILDVQITSNDYQLNALQANQNYYWRVRTADTLQGIATGSAWLPVHQFTTRTNPVVEESDPVTVSVDFGGTSGGSEGNGGEGAVEKTKPEQTDYRMVGLPGTDNIRLNEFFEGSYKKKWRAFIETGDQQEFYDEYEEGDERFTFRPGLGFWVLSTEIVTANMEFTAVETNAEDSYGFPVHPGWNIIANPYQSAVEWAAVEAFNEIESPLYGYDERFMQADTLKPFQGYYYYNDPARNRDSLFIPYTGFEQRTSDEPAAKDLSPLKDAGTISLKALFHDSSTTSLEMLFGSRQKLASFRRPYPNLQFARAGAVLAKEEESRLRYQRTLSSARPEDETYLMEVKAPVGSTTTWSLELQEMSDWTGALLVNKVTNQSFLLEQEKKRKIKHTEPLSRYDVYVGDITYLKEVQEKLLPQEFELSQNYPNPFNPVTNIRYALPERAEVRLEVYDILGRKVHTLVNQRQRAGWHVVNWDASGLASGMYLYRLSAGDYVSVKKLTLIK